MSAKGSGRRPFVLLVVLAVVAVVVWSFSKRPLDVPPSPGIPLPSLPEVEGVWLSVIPTAEIKSLEGFSVRGGSMLSGFNSGVAAFLVEHPRGKFLIDAGLGRDAESHLATVPWLMRVVTDLDVIQPTVDALKDGGVNPKSVKGILLTHGHWDHVSGLADFKQKVPIWLTSDELEYLWKDDGGRLFRELQAQFELPVKEYQFTDGAYGPFPWSKDVFGDGSVILLALEGHTPGSIAVLVNLASGKRYLFIGDTAWTKEGVEWPAERPFMSRFLVDDDPALVRDQLVFLNKLQQTNPELVIVPAHDSRVHARMAQFPNREK
ncbi:MAG: MBL fold metallo-hydrolase [Myxococcota bacterium]